MQGVPYVDTKKRLAFVGRGAGGLEAGSSLASDAVFRLPLLPARAERCSICLYKDSADAVCRLPVLSTVREVLA